MSTLVLIISLVDREIEWTVFESMKWWRTQVKGAPCTRQSREKRAGGADATL
jgi:hypothetical protein